MTQHSQPKSDDSFIWSYNHLCYEGARNALDCDIADGTVSECEVAGIHSYRNRNGKRLFAVYLKA